MESVLLHATTSGINLHIGEWQPSVAHEEAGVIIDPRSYTFSVPNDNYWCAPHSSSSLACDHANGLSHVAFKKKHMEIYNIDSMSVKVDYSTMY